MNTLIKRGLGRTGIDEELERLFARGIDPDDGHALASTSSTEGAARWPSFVNGSSVASSSNRRAREAVEVPAGQATLGAARGLAPFGWDNEFERHPVQVPAFRIDAQKVTDQEFLDFVQADGYATASGAGADCSRPRTRSTRPTSSTTSITGSRR